MLTNSVNNSSSTVPTTTPKKSKKTKSSKDSKKRRNFQINHIHVALDIKLESCLLKGHVIFKIQINTQSRRVTQLKLHARQLNVENVYVENIKTQFLYKNYLDSPAHSQPPELRELKTFNVLHKSALDANEDGNFYISIPSEIDTTKQNQLTVKIEYNVYKPRGGVHFACVKTPQKKLFNLLSNEAKFVVPPMHLFTHNQVQGARHWIPCLDNQTSLSTWSFEYRAPSEYTVVSSGELVATRIDTIPYYDNQMDIEIDTNNNNNNNNNDNYFGNNNNTNQFIEVKTSYFELNVPTLPQNIALACGPFEILPDPFNSEVTHFCLPGLMTKLSHTIQFFNKAMQICEEYLGVPMPFTSYKHVFVEESYTKIAPYASLSICSSELIHDHHIIDQVFETRRLLISALCQQWIGSYITIKSWSDSWLRFGLVSFITSKVLREIIGNNEITYNSIKDFEVVTKLDIDLQPPIHWHHYLHPIQLYNTLMYKKSYIVMTMIERKLGADPFQMLISKLVNVPQKESKALDRIISTRNFMKLIQKVTMGPDIKAFEKQWISGRGCPNLLCGFVYNKKRQHTEFAVQQLLPQRERFAGALTVRINELDGTYDHILQFDDEFNGSDFPCNSRLRKNRKKKIKYANGEEIEVDLTRRDNPLLWIRIDPHFDWGPLVRFRQPEYMWVLQLEMDRDVISQYFSIKEISSTPSYNVTSALIDVVNDQKAKYFYKIRMEAAYALAVCANTESELISLDKLIGYFKSQFYDYQMTILKPNNFSSYPLYFLKMAVVEAISTVKINDTTPNEVLVFLLDLLKNNDNTYNDYSDYSYLATIIKSLRNIKTQNQIYLQKLQKQIDRFLNIEKLMPSFHLEITAACLKSLCHFQYEKYAKLNIEAFSIYTEYGNPVNVRSQAIKSTLLLSSQFLPISLTFWDLFFNLMYDPNEIPRLKYKVAKGIHKTIDKKRFNSDKYREISHVNQTICNKLWGLLNSDFTAYDCRLRWSIVELYKSLYTSDLPACFPPDYYKDTLIDELKKNIEFLAPSKKAAKRKLSSNALPSYVAPPVSPVSSSPLSPSPSISPVPSPTPSDQPPSDPKIRLVLPNPTKRRKVASTSTVATTYDPLNPQNEYINLDPPTKKPRKKSTKRKSEAGGDPSDPSFTSKKKRTKKTSPPKLNMSLSTASLINADTLSDGLIDPLPNNSNNNSNNNNGSEKMDLTIKFTLDGAD